MCRTGCADYCGLFDGAVRSFGSGRCAAYGRIQVSRGRAPCTEMPYAKIHFDEHKNIVSIRRERPDGREERTVEKKKSLSSCRDGCYRCYKNTFKKKKVKLSTCRCRRDGEKNKREKRSLSTRDRINPFIVIIMISSEPTTTTTVSSVVPCHNPSKPPPFPATGDPSFRLFRRTGYHNIVSRIRHCVAVYGRRVIIRVRPTTRRGNEKAVAKKPLRNVFRRNAETRYTYDTGY